MEKKNLTSIIAVVAFLAIVIAGALYADKVYKAPEAPPEILYTIQGPVILEEEAVVGDLITAPNSHAIYYLNADKKRVIFPDKQTFLSWYEDFSAIKTVSKELLEKFPLSGYNATIRPGTWLITIPTSTQVWTVSNPNNLHWLLDGEEQVELLFGKDWKDRLVDIPEYYYVNYKQGADIEGTQAYPAGLVVKAVSNGQYYLVDHNGQRLISEDGFKANRFQERFVVSIPEPLDIALAGPTLDEYEARWASPDKNEVAKDMGPEDLDVGDAEAMEG